MHIMNHARDVHESEFMYLQVVKDVMQKDHAV